MLIVMRRAEEGERIEKFTKSLYHMVNALEKPNNSSIK